MASSPYPMWSVVPGAFLSLIIVCWEWPRRVSDNYENTTAQCDKLDRFVALYRRFLSWSRLPPWKNIADRDVAGGLLRTVISDRRVSSEPQPVDG